MSMMLGQLTLVLSFIFANIAFANPEGAVVVAGELDVSSCANTLTVTQHTPQAIVNWDSFNIQAGEHARFLQPDGGIILNRINANNGASQILGQLSANGTVLLINQAGILFGKNAQVDVGGIIAATSDITNENFLHNKFTFNQSGYANAAVINHGKITAKENGLVALIGNNVRNDGLIIAKMGKVGLAQGDNITVDLYGDDLISFGMQANGMIDAAQSQDQCFLLTPNAAQEILDQSINLVGIEATSVVEHEGKIIFTGEIKAPAGQVQILGETVIANESANIDVSDTNGGGTVLIGGDFQGNNSKILNSKRTYIGKDVTIKADALDNGDGGKVIIWADDITKFFGNVSARGGSISGNGGFVEISSKNENLVFEPSSPVYTTAANGVTGTLLLDPAFLTVVTTGGSAYSAGVNNLFANNSAGTNLITPASIVTAAIGANILLQANTDVTFTNALAIGTSARSLTVQAGRSVLINAAVSTTNGAISIAANDTAATSADRAAGAGAITMGSGATLNSGTAALSLTVGPSASAPYTPGDITALGLTGGAVSLTTPNALTATTIAASVSLGIDVGATSTVSGIISGNATLAKNGAGLLNLMGANTYLGATSLNAGTIRASNATAFGNSAGGVTGASGTTIEINGVAITTEAFTIAGTGDGGIGALVGTGTCSHTGTVTMTADTTIGGTGTFTQSGIVSGAFNLTKIGSGTTIFSAANTYNGTTAINEGTLRASNATALGVVAPAVTVASGATLDVNGVAIGAKPLSISGTGVGGNGALIGTGTSSYAGAISMLADTTFGGTGTFTISGLISGVGINLIKTGSGSISLSGANTYSGTTAVNVGTLRASNATALGSTATTITVASGATLDINAVAVGAKPLSISGTGVSGLGALTGTGTGSYAGAITMLGDTTFGGAGTTTISGAIGGGFNLRKIGSGLFIFSTSNSYTGSTTINAGTLRISSDANLGTAPGAATPGQITLGGGTLQATAAFTLNANRGIELTSATSSTIRSDVSTLTYNGIIAGSGNWTKTGAGIFALGGTNTYNGTTTINAGTLSMTVANGIANTTGLTLANVAGVTFLLNNNNQTIGRLSGGGTTGGTITLGSATLSVNQTSDATYAGTITGTGGLTLTSSSTNTLSLTNSSSSYSGITTINGGAISIIADTNLGTAPGVATAGKIAINGGTLIGNASFTLNANRGIALSGTGGIIQVNPGFTLTYNGVIAGGAGFTKTGTGTLSSSGVHTYTGSTTISNGTFSLNAANQLINSSDIIFADTAGAVLEFNGFDQTINNLSGGGLNGGEISLGVGSVNIVQTSAGTFGGIFSGSGNISLSNSSSNVLTLSNSSTAFSGNWNLNGGTLSISFDTSLGAVPGAATAGKINFNGGILQTTADMTLNSNRGIAILASGATFLVDPTTTLIYNGILAGSTGGALNKSGTGILILGGSNTYDGATNISAGILSLTSANALGSTTGTTVTNGAELDLNFNSATLANTNTIVLNGTGVGGAGALSFSGSFITVNNPLTIASSTTIGGVGAGTMTLGGTITSSSALNFNLSTGAIVLPTINMNNAALTVAAGGSMTQSGPITLTGTATASFAANSANTDITLSQANNFGGTAPSFTGTLGNIRDLYLRDTNAAASLPSFTGFSSLRNLTLVFNNAAMALPAITLTNSGIFSATAGGAITQSGVLTVPGTSSFTTGAFPITLGQNNLLTGAVAFSNSGANDVSITNAANLIFATSSIGRNLSATATGAITETGILVVPGTASFNAGANQINLFTNNQFTGAVNLSNSGNNFTVIKNALPLVLGVVTIGQDLIASSGGSITQNGTDTITATNGSASFASTAANSDIILSNANSFGSIAPAFAGTRSNIRDVNIRNISANASVPSFTGLSNLRNLTLLFNNSAMALTAATLTGGGALNATAGGAITQTGPLVVPGTSSFTSGANPITLNDSNQFTGVVTLSNSGANNVSINNTTALTLAGMTVGRNFTANAIGDITQTGSFTVPGKSSFTATGGLITLNLSNALTGSVSVSNTGSNDISITNTLATDIGQSSVGRNITLNSGATISQSYPLTVTNGTATFSVGSASSSILLPENNDFGTIAPVFSGTTSNIVNINLKNINSSPATPSFTGLSNLHFLELAFPNGTAALSSLTMNGTAIISANNATGTLNVHGLQLGTNFCNLFGFVNGLSGQDAIDQIVLLNTITSGTHFFDGIDMYGSTPPTPPTPTPVSPTVVGTARTDINNILYMANNYWNSLKTTDIEFEYFTILDLQHKNKYAENLESCTNYGSNIEVCY